MRKGALILLYLVVAGLQAWDSGATDAGALILAGIAIALLIPVADIAGSRTATWHLAAWLGTVALLVITRLLAPAPLPGMLLIATLAGIVLFADVMLAGYGSPQVPPGGSVE